MINTTFSHDLFSVNFFGNGQIHFCSSFDGQATPLPSLGNSYFLIKVDDIFLKGNFLSVNAFILAITPGFMFAFVRDENSYE